MSKLSLFQHCVFFKNIMDSRKSLVIINLDFFQYSTDSIILIYNTIDIRAHWATYFFLNGNKIL